MLKINLKIAKFFQPFIFKKNKELITELENQTLYNHEMMRKVKKNDRKFKDLAMVADEEKLFRGRLELNIDELNAKVKCLKSQLEDTEQQSSDNLSKLRRMQSDYNTATMRADNAENQLANFKTRSRVSVQVFYNSFFFFRLKKLYEIV